MLSPLDLPSRKMDKPKEQFKVPHRLAPQFLGICNEKVKESSTSSESISVVVSGVSGSGNGSYTVAYSKGQTLGKYLSTLKLKRIGIYHAVYDETNLSNGRCRMTYIPQSGAVIRIGSSAIGSATKFQRSNHDAQRIAARMGGDSKVVEVLK